MPPGEQLSVVETPEYLRNVMPFAAYFAAPKFGADGRPAGIYVVTPSVDGDPRRHARAQLRVDLQHVDPRGVSRATISSCRQRTTIRASIRLLVDAPEFVEGWAMYCELMMREEGFDTAPSTA